MGDRLGRVRALRGELLLLNKTYGALAGVVIFLVWLWISNIAILLGAEFNAEIERGRRLEAGQPAEQEPFVEPRRTPKAPRR